MAPLSGTENATEGGAVCITPGLGMKSSSIFLLSVDVGNGAVASGSVQVAGNANAKSGDGTSIQQMPNIWRNLKRLGTCEAMKIGDLMQVPCLLAIILV